MIALYLFVGFMVGGTLGVMVMCCFQLSKESDKHVGGTKENDSKKE